MKKIELKIELDPVTDGATITSDNPVSKEDGALVISTTGESRIVDQDEANEILERLTGKSTCEYLGSTDYLMIYNRDKIINADDGRYFMGSAIISTEPSGVSKCSRKMIIHLQPRNSNQGL